MLHFGPGMGYVYNGTSLQNGIACDMYKANIEVPGINATLDVKYFWTNPESWDSTAGKNIPVPVLARVTGEYNLNEEIHFADMYFEFSDFQIPKETYGDDLFYPPSDLYCQGRKLDAELPAVSDFFSYTSEAIFYWIPPLDNAQGVWIVSPRQEYYDHLMKVSRTDYKPIDYAAILDPEDTNQLPYLSEIKDFSSGIMYRIWSDWGNCSLDWIGSSTIGDVNINQDGTISMMSPLEMFHLDSKFAANSFGVRSDSKPGGGNQAVLRHNCRRKKNVPVTEIYFRLMNVEFK